jgi:hypothetical protein
MSGSSILQSRVPGIINTGIFNLSGRRLEDPQARV